MAIIGLSIAETEEIVLSRDPSAVDAKGKLLDVSAAKAAGATVFTIGALDSYTRAILNDSIVRMIQRGDEMEMVPNRNVTAIKAAKYGITGWSNYKDDKGNDIPFKTVKEFRNGKTYQVVSDSCLEHLDPVDIAELGERIMAKNSIGIQLAGK